MKKLLLLAAVAVSAMTANAQALQPKAQMQKVKVQNVAQNMKVDLAQTSGPRKLVTDGCYYVRPEGSMGIGWDKDGKGYYVTMVVVSPYKEATFVNKCTKKEDSSWSWDALSDPKYISYFVDDDNNFFNELDGATMYSMPTLTSGKTQYTFGQTDNRNGSQYTSYMRCMEGVDALSFTDPHIGTSLSGWGYISTHYLFGDGTLDDDGNTYQCFGVMQEFPKPMSPLYVEDIYMNLTTLDKATFLEAGQELVLEILSEDDEVLYTLTAGPDDLTIEEDEKDTQYGTQRYAQAVFSMKDVDPLTGDIAAVPFVINEPFKVFITGIEGTGIGFYGHLMQDMTTDAPTVESTFIQNGYNYFYNVNDENDVVAYTFKNKIALPMTFSAMFDAAQVWEQAVLDDENNTEITDFNVLNVSADGQTIQNAGYPALNSVNVNTACGWFDEDETEMYYLADCDDEFPEWLSYGVDNSAWTDYDPETENPGPTVYIGLVEVEPLPAGVEGRGCKLYVNGRGITSDAAIYVLQGNFTKEQADAQESTGVNSVLAPKAHNGKTYNVAGQQVSKNFKGIVVKDGKKFINK